MSGVRELGPVDPSAVIAWVTAIPFTEWPQQHKVDEQLRPAMVNDPSWHSLALHTNGLVRAIMVEYLPIGSRDSNRMLSVVMPGHTIPSHRDEQPDAQWVTRVHVPLTTNDAVEFVSGGNKATMRVGVAYTVDTRVRHSISNRGTTPRIHFMFDVYAALGAPEVA